MYAPQIGILHTETKREISEAAEKLLVAHYGLIDPQDPIFRRISDSEFLVRTGDATFLVKVSTRIG